MLGKRISLPKLSPNWAKASVARLRRLCTALAKPSGSFSQVFRKPMGGCWKLEQVLRKPIPWALGFDRKSHSHYGHFE